MKKVIIIMLVAACSMMLSGCSKKHSKADISNYVKEELGLDNFTVKSSPKQLKDEEGYTDYLWTVELNGDADISFYVIDNYGMTTIGVLNDLTDNYDAVMLEYLFDEYDEFDDIELSEYEFEGMPIFRLTGEFEDREELRSVFDELIDFSEYVEKSDYDIELSVYLEHQNILRNQSEHEVRDGDVYINDEEITEADYEDALKTYMYACLNYRFEEQLADFTDEEIAQMLKDYEKCISILREDETYEFYDDLCASKYGYGISYGTLYEILVKEGYEVEGDCWEYSFVGVDGDIYEISYDYCDYKYEYNGEEYKGYYYIKNGEKVPMGAYFHNHFLAREVKEMTGIELKIGTWK